MTAIPSAEAAPASGAAFVGVALDLPVDRLFTYRVPEPLRARVRLGQRILVTFRGRKQTGVIAETRADAAVKGILDAADIPDEEPLLPESLLSLGRFAARYYGASLGETLAAMVPRGVRGRGKGARRTLVRLAPGAVLEPPSATGEVKPRERILRLLGRHPEGFVLADLLRRARVSASPVKTLAGEGRVVLEQERADADPLVVAADRPAEAEPVPESLTPAQSEAVAAVLEAVEAGTWAPFLLLGVTGSGKTEVYLRGIEACRRQGRQAVVLVPEIALTPQTVRRFRARFDRVAVLHSGMTEADRAAAWRRIRRGEADVVIGPRSAVFAPVPRLGLVVVDEEHEASFKQQNAPRYHARDLALVRAREAGAVAILGSATPSLESYRHALDERYRLLRLPERVGGRTPPPVAIVDLKRAEERPPSGRSIGRTLETRIREALRDGGQVLLLQNRRGFATSVACPRCGFVLRCGDCDVGLTYHRSERSALCHLCGHEVRPPAGCPDCGLPGLKYRGAGTETVEAEVSALFPDARVARMDSDAMATREAYEEVLGRFERREVDVLVGTQMIAKGLHFPGITLVGIVSADTALAVPDFRSAERTFSLVAQVAGRTGRGEASGRVVVQTLLPDHPSVALATNHDFEAFAQEELRDRRLHGYPPYRRLLRVVWRGRSESALDARAAETAKRLSSLPDLELLGPAVPPVARVQGLSRRHLLVKSPTPAGIARALAHLKSAPHPRAGVEEIHDIDPVGLL